LNPGRVGKGRKRTIDLKTHSINIDSGLTAFCNCYPVDGRVSWHDPNARGIATCNCYLLQSGGESLLIDTGLGVHRAAILRQLRGALADGERLSLLALRQGEFDSVGNLLPLVDGFDVDVVYGQFDDVLEWADFVPELTLATGRPPQIGGAVSKVLPREGEVTIGNDGPRTIQFFRPVLRLLSTHWIYDRSSRTLFTSDSFGYNVQPDESGPWELDVSNDRTTVDTVREHLRTTRYWWIAESAVTEVRQDLADTFKRLDVENIAPAFGSLIRGRNAVEHHVKLLDEAISQLGLCDQQLQTSGGTKE
jgi:glyoxylase-like metal-dependent hydrolase (beta-lactamase superfamily II)